LPLSLSISVAEMYKPLNLRLVDDAELAATSKRQSYLTSSSSHGFSCRQLVDDDEDDDDDEYSSASDDIADSADNFIDEDDVRSVSVCCYINTDSDDSSE